MRSSVASRTIAFLFVMALCVALSSSVFAQDTGTTPPPPTTTPPPPTNMIPGQPPQGAMPPGATAPDMSQFKNMMPPGFDPSKMQNGQGAPDMSKFSNTVPPGFDPNKMQNGMPAGTQGKMMPDNQGDMQSGFPGAAGSFKGIGKPPGLGNGEGMQNGQMQTGSNGKQMPNMEEMQKKQEEQQKKMEEQQKKMQAGVLAQMKKAGEQFGRQIALVQKRVDALKAKNVNAPETLTKAIADSQALIAKAAASTDVAEMQDILPDMQDQSDILQQEMPKLEQLAQLPNVLKRAEQELAKLKKAVERTKVALKRAGGDYSDQTKEIDGKIAEIRTAIDNAKAGKVAEGADNVIESLQDTAFAMFEDAWQMEGSLEAVRQFKQTVTAIDKQVKNNDRIIASLVKRKEDVADAKDLQAKIKVALADLKANVNSKNIDSIYDKLTGFSDLQQQFEDSVAVTQTDNAGDNVKPNAQNGFGVPAFDAPSGLPGSSNFDEKSIDGLKSIAPFIKQ